MMPISICRLARRNLRWPAIGLGAILFFATHIQASAQQSFKSPQEAVQALVAAARADNRGQLLAVLGRAARDIIESGDPVADEGARAKFVAAYDEANRLAQEGKDQSVLIIGQEQWPFPIPLVRVGESWRFDAAAGREEILARRIGRNERSAIQASLAYVDAQNEYALMQGQGTGVARYARRIVSRPGKKDGLYWPAKQGEALSPLGALVAAAAREGYQTGRGRIPYYGYYYRILKRQGPAAPGGAYDYVVRGKMIGGFALIAYPAQYRNSGVMTFIVNHEGVVYQKDLGPRTAKIASRIGKFDPDRTWQKVSPEPSTADVPK
jgi:hypothetical protein